MTLLDTVENGDIEQLKELLTQPFSVEDATQALIASATHRKTEFIKLLIPVSDPTFANSKALTQSAFQQHIEGVQLLLPYCDPSHNHSNALYWVLWNDFYAAGGWDHIIDALLPISNINDLQRTTNKKLLAFMTEKICAREKHAIEQELPGANNRTSTRKKI